MSWSLVPPQPQTYTLDGPLLTSSQFSCSLCSIKPASSELEECHRPAFQLWIFLLFFTDVRSPLLPPVDTPTALCLSVQPALGSSLFYASLPPLRLFPQLKSSPKLKPNPGVGKVGLGGWEASLTLTYILAATLPKSPCGTSQKGLGQIR